MHCVCRCLGGTTRVPGLAIQGARVTGVSKIAGGQRSSDKMPLDTARIQEPEHNLGLEDREE